jgi:hypothetical protein
MKPYINQQAKAGVMTKKQAQANTGMEKRLTWPGARPD